jgi:ABC-type nitrate/sulfonate/bicarbonate transport system substrate-binding protein
VCQRSGDRRNYLAVEQLERSSMRTHTDQKLPNQILRILASAEIGIPEPGTIVPLFEVDRALAKAGLDVSKRLEIKSVLRARGNIR